MFQANVLPEISGAASPWPIVAWSVVSLLLGGGTVGTVVKVWADRRSGIASHEVAEDDAIVARWRELSDAQTKALRGVIEELRADVEALKADHRAMRLELTTSRTKYWRAVGYARSLRAWIDRHVPHDQAAQLPPVPDLLAEDI